MIFHNRNLLVTTNENALFFEPENLIITFEEIFPMPQESINKMLQNPISKHYNIDKIISKSKYPRSFK